MKNIFKILFISSIFIICIVGCHKDSKKVEEPKEDIKEKIDKLICTRTNESIEEISNQDGTLTEKINITYKNDKMDEYNYSTELIINDENIDDNKKEEIKTELISDCTTQDRNCLSHESNVDDNIITTNITYNLNNIDDVTNNEINKKMNKQVIKQILESSNYRCN